MKCKPCNRLLSLVLAAVLLIGLFPTVRAERPEVIWRESDQSFTPDLTDRLVTQELQNQEETRKPNETVRVSIVLEEKPTIQAGFSTWNIGSNVEAMAYDAALLDRQQTLARTISVQALGGRDLDVVWNLTLVGNVISANVPYGSIDAIGQVDGVKSVCVEQQYMPNTAESVSDPMTHASGIMTGAHTAWSGGYTGAGSRVAIIDTGTDTEHQSFDNGAYLYALECDAALAGAEYEDYVRDLNLLDETEIAAILGNLNVSERSGFSAQELYINEKLPFGYNYVDGTLNVSHLDDGQGEHGSHVAGIAAANRFIPTQDGYADAVEQVYAAGVAPDAQILTMKVFGRSGGAYESDYMAAIEDAILLGADAVNLSLGSAKPGVTYNDAYASFLAYLETTETVVVMSAGNSGRWAQNAWTGGYLYNDGVSFDTVGSPGSYTNSLAVASVDNIGSVGHYFTVGGQQVFYNEVTGYGNPPMAQLDTSADGAGTAFAYILIDGVGLETDYAGLDLTGKVAICARGSISFAEKANTAAALGAAAVVIYNNAPGDMYLDLTGYSYSIPVVAIRQSAGGAIREASQAGEGCFQGSLTVFAAAGAAVEQADHHVMSSFSSWGVPGNLSMKPEITAPGGNIWSVWGSTPAGGGSDQYEMMSGTSMAAPQVTGMTALVAQHLREQELSMEGVSMRQLAQSLLMSTAQPMRDESGNYHSILSQGAGLGRVDLAVNADSFVLVEGQPDGKVKAELGDDPERAGEYRVSFTIHDLTGAGMEYRLRADVFTQAILEQEGVRYLDTRTAELPAKVSFLASGSEILPTEALPEHDLNGDGVTDALDADHLLEYLLGNATELHADGDISGNGTVNTYDAHVLLAQLQAKYSVTVPAGGSVTVEAVICLTDETKALLEEQHPAGAYIQAYLFAEPVGEGVSHSIPVLGYYGSWTDGSMFDIGSYAEFQGGTEQRIPYLYGLGYGLAGENRVNGDYLTIDYGDGEEYYWGGNPITTEAEYLPQRNAMNNANGAKLLRFGDTLIRNAAGTRLVMTNTDTGEVYRDELLGAMDAAYYHTNEGTWYNYRFRTSINWAGTDPSGEALPEGTTVELSFIAAPEYYRMQNADGSTTIDWDALGEGAYETTLITIDNTAPVIDAMQMHQEETDILEVTATDNEYVAAVALLNARGTAMLAAAPGNQTQKNEQVTVELDLSGVFGDEFLVAVYDYAMNATVYEVRLELRGQRPYYTILEPQTDGSGYLWKGYEPEEGTEGSVLGRLQVSSGPSAVEFVDGYVFTVTGIFDDFKLQVSRDDDLEVFYEAELDPSGALMLMGVEDLAYNPADGKLYALASQIGNFWSNPYFAVIDMELGTIECLGELAVGLDSLACDENGNFYGFPAFSSDLYTFTADTYGKPELVGSAAPYSSSFMSSGNLTWDDLTDKLCWITFREDVHYLLEVEPDTAAVRVIRTLPDYTAGLYVRTETTGEVFQPADQVHSIQLSESAETLLHNRVSLNAVVRPWTVASDAVTWTSDNEAVAVVDDQGVVTGMSVGTANITAASVLDPGVTASCVVTVTSLDRDLEALVWDESGQVWWSSFNTDKLPAYEKRTEQPAEEPFASAVRLPGGEMYAATLESDLTSSLYRILESNMEPVLIGGSDVGYFDLAWAPNLTQSGMLLSVYGPYVVLVDPATGDYLGAFEWSEDADLVGIAYCETVMNNTYSELVDYFYLIDADGNVYREGFMDIGDTFYYYDGPARGYMIDLGHRVSTSYYHSAYYDANTNYLYWSAYSEEDDRVELLVCNMRNGRIYKVGEFDQGVWPVGGLMAPAAVSTESMQVMEGEAMRMSLTEAEQLVVPAAGIHSVGMSAQDNADHQEDSVFVEVAVPMDSTNGIAAVSYDPQQLTVTGVTGLTEAFAWTETENTLTMAYAGAKALIAGESAAVVTFAVTGDAAGTEVTLKYGECNEETLDQTVTIPVALIHDCPSAAFSDLELDEWYHEAVDFVLERGLMIGMSDTIFAPEGIMNRAQMVTILYRMAGCPEVAYSNPFADVPEESWFTDAVIWAYQNGITTGITENHFAPEAPVAREQMVAFLARWYAANGVEITGGDLSGYTDADSVNDYAKEAMAWAVENGIVQGITADTLQPHSGANRAQIATILMRCSEKFGG